MKSGFAVPFFAAGFLLLSEALAAASTIPVSYFVDERTLKREAPAGTIVTFELHEDPNCTAAIASDPIDVDDIVIKQRVKTRNLKGGLKKLKLVELHHVFSATPSDGADLFVRVTGTGIDTTAVGECQAQEPIGSGAPGPAGPTGANGTVGPPGPTGPSGPAGSCTCSLSLNCISRAKVGFVGNNTLISSCQGSEVVTGGGVQSLNSSCYVTVNTKGPGQSWMGTTDDGSGSCAHNATVTAVCCQLQ